jgi:SAM-dependent methyltransferase
MEWFATWFDTRYYHLLYQNRDYSEADGFVTELFNSGILKPGMAICDLACGKGRHARAMHEHGARQVIGLDLSPESIAAANELAVPGLTFAVHDMRKAMPVEELDAVTNLFTSFGYFDHLGQNSEVLKHIAKSLNPGGTFVLDFLNATRIKEKIDTGKMVVEREGVQFVTQKQLVDGAIVKRIEVEENGEKFHFMERVQLLEADTLRHLCNSVGLEVIDTYGDYSLHEFDAQNSPRCILIAKKE